MKHFVFLLFLFLLKGKYEIIAIVNTQGIDKAKVTSHKIHKVTSHKIHKKNERN